MQEIRGAAATLEHGTIPVEEHAMRGRKPRPVTLDGDDAALLQFIARSRSAPWLQVQHAQILLAVAAGQRIQTVVSQVRCDPATVWRVCRRYEQHGLDAVLWEGQR